MNSFEMRQFIARSLTRRGASCETEGISIIIATWKTTVWRIFIDSLSIDYKQPAILVEVDAALQRKHQAVIARIRPDGHIEYRNAENGKIIRPRCLVKRQMQSSLKKEFYEQS
jgi:hypothetical protein